MSGTRRSIVVEYVGRLSCEARRVLAVQVDTGDPKAETPVLRARVTLTRPALCPDP